MSIVMNEVADTYDDLTEEDKKKVREILERLGLVKREYSQDERRQALEAITQARVTMLFRYPFWGQLALSFQIVDGTDFLPIPTAGTDGQAIFIHAGFVNKLDPEQVIFLLAHEISHVMYDHLSRKGDDRKHKRWNIAGDHVINLMLMEQKIGKVIDQIDIYADPKYTNWVTEEVYEDLPEDVGGLTLDNHFPGKGTPDDIRRAVLEASQSCSAEEVPSFARSMIKDLTEPKMSWDELLQVNLDSSVHNDFNWMRNSRKAWHLQARLPGHDDGVSVDVAIAIDTSGSISDQMLKKFLSEVAGIMEQFDHYRLSIFQFDTGYYGLDVFTEDDGRDITEYDIRGGGGTDFAAIFKCLEDNEIEPDQLVVFTDGETYNWGDPNYCDTLFVITSAYNVKKEAPFGQTVNF